MKNKKRELVVQICYPARATYKAFLKKKTGIFYSF